MLRFRNATLLFLALLSAEAFAQPAVTVSPTSGPPTDKVSVGGAGFAANEAVGIYFDATDLALATAGSNGAFGGIPLAIPASATPGRHWITGVGQHSGLAAQATFKVQTDWPQFLGGPEHHGYNPTENVLSVSNVGGLQLLWTATTLGVNSSPVLADGVIYVNSHCRWLYAFDAATGKTLWVSPTGDSPNHIYPTPAVANGVVYSGSNDGLYAFSTETGGQLWSAFSGYSVETVTVANGVLYVDSGRLYALNAQTGEQLWIAANANYISSSAAVQGGVVYEGSIDGSEYALDRATGQQIWQSPNTNGSVFGASSVANGVVYVQSYDGLYAYRTATGELLWSGYVGSTISSSPAVANGVVYLGSENSNVYALNAATGEILWTAATDYPVRSGLVVANGILYATSDDTLYAFGLPGAPSTAPPDPAALKPGQTLLP